MSRKIIKIKQTTPINAEVVDSLDSTSSTNALSAAQGRVLYNYIQNLNIRLNNLSEEFDTKKLYINGTVALSDSSATPDVQDPTIVGQIPNPIVVNTQEKQLAFEGAGYHNCIYRGKDLTNVYTIGEISARVANGKFNDLYIGDYINTTVNGQNVKMTFAGFNLFLDNPANSSALSDNHIVMVCSPIGVSSMLSTTDNSSGYIGSTIHTTVLPAFYTNLATAIGSSHIIQYNAMLSGSVSSGEVTITTAVQVALCLMSEINVFGTQVYDNIGLDSGYPAIQFPLFRYNPYAIYEDNVWYWLKNIPGSSYFCGVSSDGSPGYAVANDTSIDRYVKPFFLFK